MQYKMRESKDGDNMTEIRLALTGAKNCGKSALAVRFLTRRYIGEYASNKDVTIARSICIADKAINLQVKDTTGANWLKSIGSTINWASAIVVVYSITDRGSFLVANHILENIHKQKPLNSGCTLLLGNKSDLKHLREIEKREARRLAMDFGVRYIECSAAEDFDEIHSSFSKLILEALLVQNSKLSAEITDDEDVKSPKDVIRERRRSSSQPQSFYIPSCQQTEQPKEQTLMLPFQKDQLLADKRDSLTLSSIRSLDTTRTPSPANERRRTLQCDAPRRQRKQSLRRKISGIGSRIVGSQNGGR